MLHLYPELADFQHVIWDWNGTLLYDLPHALRTVNNLLEQRRLPLLTEESYKKNFRFPIRDYYVSIGFDLDKEDFAQLCDEFVDAYMARVHECSLVEGASDLLKKIKASGKAQSILSATDQENLNKMMEHFALRPWIDRAYGIADKMAASKLDRGRELIAHSSHPREKTVLIGDTDHDLEVGKALGIEVILVTHGHQTEEKLQKLHNRVHDLFKSACGTNNAGRVLP